MTVGSGRAVDLGSGDSTLGIVGSHAHAQGDISGGPAVCLRSTTVLNGNNTNIGRPQVRTSELIVGNHAGNGRRWPATARAAPPPSPRAAY